MGVAAGVVGLGVRLDFDKTDSAVGGDEVTSEEPAGSLFNGEGRE